MKTFKIYMDMLASNHILAAGATGCGKSTLLDALIYSTFFLERSPILYLIDPKRVDLRKWRNLRNVEKRVTELNDAIALLREILEIMEERYRVMEALDQEQTEERHIYVFIDEVADLLTNKSYCKDATYLIMRIAALGRAAGVHIIMASQQIKADILDTSITNNFTCRCAMKTATSIQSRIILNGIAGAERLPDHGYGIVSIGSKTDTYQLPKIDRSDIEEIIAKNI